MLLMTMVAVVQLPAKNPHSVDPTSWAVRDARFALGWLQPLTWIVLGKKGVRKGVITRAVGVPSSGRA